MPQPLVTVHGFRELQWLIAKTDKESQKEMKALERQVAEPVKADAEGFARDRITRITPRWATMRIGVTRTLIYVAPKPRGVHGKDSPKARPKFATLMQARVMQPVADRNQPLLEHRTELLFDEIARRWGAV